MRPPAPEAGEKAWNMGSMVLILDVVWRLSSGIRYLFFDIVNGF